MTVSARVSRSEGEWGAHIAGYGRDVSGFSVRVICALADKQDRSRTGNLCRTRYREGGEDGNDR